MDLVMKTLTATELARNCRRVLDTSIWVSVVQLLALPGET